jgi:hypothetical protein
MFGAAWRKKDKHEPFYTEGHDRKVRAMRKPASFALQRLNKQQTGPRDHPDADLLAAFSEQSLRPKERAGIIAHLAGCPDCREVVALTSGAYQEQARVVSAIRRHGFAFWQWRGAAMAAAFLLIISAAPQFLLFKRTPAAISQPNLPLLDLHKPQLVVVTPPSLQMRIRRSTATKRPTSGQNSPAPERKVRETVIATVLQPEVTPPALARPARMIPETLGHYAFNSEAAPASIRTVLSAKPGKEKTVWQLENSPEGGALRKSEDGGATWVTAPVGAGTRLYALSAAGPEIWVGGADGKLFHSTDNGTHWNPVAVAYAASQLSEAIVEIDSQGSTVTLKTSSGATLTSDDHGIEWHRR